MKKLLKLRRIICIMLGILLLNGVFIPGEMGVNQVQASEFLFPEEERADYEPAYSIPEKEFEAQNPYDNDGFMDENVNAEGNAVFRAGPPGGGSPGYVIPIEEKTIRISLTFAFMYIIFISCRQYLKSK